MKLLLSLVFYLFALPVTATNYYFSSSTGDDNRTIEQAKNPATPFRSIDKLNTFNLTLKPGDSVLFRRGDVFYGSMVVKARGTAAANVYFGAYGTGANPVITGFTTLSTWTVEGGGVYSTPLNAGPLLNMVTVNGAAKGMGRWPNSGYLTYEDKGTTSIVDNQLQTSPSWTGAEIVVRKHRFILDRHLVTSHQGTRLYYSHKIASGDSSSFPTVKGNGYFFQNHRQTLDTAGEWFYDTVVKRLYLHFGTQSPAGLVVKASTLATNCFVTSAEHLTFENLVFEGGNNRGLWVTSTHTSLIKNCHFLNQGAHSLHAVSVNNITVKGGSVTTSFSNGVFFDNVTNCTIDGVSVNYTNTIPGTAKPSTGMSVGITANGNGNRVINNQVRNSGYNGISFVGNNVLIEKNLVDTFCTLKDDGAGIYTYVGSSNEAAFNRIIRNNIILNAIGAFAGAESYYYEQFGKAAGIYLDEHANNVEITGNTIATGDWGGIFLHNAHHCAINGNLVYNHRHQVLVSQYTAGTRSITMNENQYVARTAAQETFYYKSYAPDSPANMGGFDNNVYARPLDDNKTITVDYLWTGGSGTSLFSLAQWKTVYGLDLSSTTSPLTFTGNLSDSLLFAYNATHSQTILSLAGSYVGMKGEQRAGHIALEPFTGTVLLKSRLAFLPNQVITFPAIGAKRSNEVPFQLLATATSGLPVSYRVVAGPATVAGNTLTLTGAGTVVVEAVQGGNAAFKAATPVSQSFLVSLPKDAQSITFPTISNKTFGDAPFNPGATASSGLPVVYQVVLGQATLNGSTLTITGAGPVTVEATQAGNESFHAAPPVAKSFVVEKSGQVINFKGMHTRQYVDKSFVLALTDTATSRLPVSFTVVSGPATLAGNQLTVTGTGFITIDASQPGNGNYLAAAMVRQTFLVERAEKYTQTINFPAISRKTVGVAPFPLGATATSGLPVSYRVTAGPATVSGDMVTLTGPGEVWIEASQPGDFNYQAAGSTSRQIMVDPAVTKSAQTISFPAIATKTYGDAPFVLAASATSGLAITFRVVSGEASVTGNTLTIDSAGFVTIEASQAGNHLFLAAQPVSQTINVGKKVQAIVFPAMATRKISDVPLLLNAKSTSGLPVSFRLGSGPAIVNNGVVIATGTGEVWIEASQPGDRNYQQAPAKSERFFVVADNTEHPSVRYEWLCPSLTKSVVAAGGAAGSGYQWQVKKPNSPEYVPLTDNAFYSGTSSATLNLLNAPSWTYGYRYRCRITTNQTVTYTAETVVRFYTVWTGGQNTAWEATGNWVCAILPDSNIDVYVPTGKASFPFVQTNTSCRSLHLGTGATLTTKPGYRLTVGEQPQ